MTPEYSFTVAFASAVPLKVGVLSLVMSSVLEEPESEPEARSGAEGAEGAAVSMVTLRPEESAEMLPARSVW